MIEECCGNNSPAIHGRIAMPMIETYLKLVTVSTLLMLFAINQTFATVIINKVLISMVIGEEKAQSINDNRLLAAILVIIWVLVPLIKYERAGKIKLMMKALIFTSLVMCSILFCHNTYKEINFPSFFP